MADTDALYQLEVKLPGENGETRTQVIKLKGLEQVIFKNRYEFPNVGSSTILYVAEDKNKIYRWDATDSVYRVVGSDYNDIEIIDCGGAA